VEYLDQNSSETSNTLHRSIRNLLIQIFPSELFAFAGLWDGWKDGNGNWIRTCTILTTTPNAATSAVHDRMPVILDPAIYDLWLDPGMTNAQVITELLKPYDAQSMRCYPMSTRINHVANDDVECSHPVELAETQNRLSRRNPAGTTVR
jgi:putative SOS response-associated peptidase YedK